MNVGVYKIGIKTRSSGFKEERKREEETRRKGFFIGESWVKAENVNDYWSVDLLAFIGIAIFFDT